MTGVRGLALALLGFTACAAPEPDQAPPSSAAPATQMERTVVVPATPLTAEPRGEAKQKASAKPAPSEPASAYDRKLWPHWIDADRDCQDARNEVLIAESYEPVTFEDDRRCEVASGRWQCPYTGDIVAEVHLLDVDHLVPLANAHRSGAASWTESQRRRYANDLEHPEHLVAVEYRANRSKGDKGPEAWLPPSEDARCKYVRDWVAVKKRWQLGMSDAEATAVAEAFEICAAGQVPPLPQTRAHASSRDEPDKQAPSDASSKCCRTCKAGKACGDSCIAKTSTCTKPPGCACDE
jgi:hypothetical protein